MKHIRYDHIGKLTCMCWADGYVMVRRPRCTPFVMTMTEWQELSLEQPA